MNKQSFKPLKYLVLLGNILYILWVTYNGIDEGLSGTLVQKASYIGLMLLLLLNLKYLADSWKK